MFEFQSTSRRTFMSRLLGAMSAPFSCTQISNGTVYCNGTPDSAEQHEPKAVCFFMDGGLSHIDSFDPKPNAGNEIRGEFNPIETSVTGLRFTELWPRLASMADRMTIIRSIQHRHNEHGSALRCMRTLQDDSGRHTPSIGSVIQWQSQSDLPTFVSLNDFHDLSGALGSNYRPFPLQGPVGSQISRSRSQGGAASISRRLNIVSKLAGLSTSGNQNDRSNDLIEQQVKIGEMLRSPVFQRMLDTSKFSSQTRARYGDSVEGEQAMLARNAVAEGMKFTIVNLPGWDMHSDLFKKSRAKVPSVDTAIAAFLEDLESSGLLESTVVLLMTEFGRSPGLDGTGRGHWPGAMSILAAGGPVPGGQVLGSTGKTGHEPVDIRHKPDDLLASIYQWFQMDWETMLPGEEARLNTSGAPISALGFG